MKKKIEISMQKDCLLVVVDGYKNQQGEAIKEYNSFSKKIWEDVPNTRIVVKRTFNSPDVYYHKKGGGTLQLLHNRGGQNKLQKGLAAHIKHQGTKKWTLVVS